MSSQSDAVLELGQKLVAELELAESNDTLGRWMAHYIAGILSEVEAADRADRAAKSQTCAQAILELWAHRSELEWHRRPLRDWEPVMRALASLDPANGAPRYFSDVRRHASDESDPRVTKWLDFADALDYSARLLIRYALVGAAEHALDKSIEWVKLAEKIGAENEGDVIVLRELAREADLLQGKTLEERHLEILEDRIGRLQEFKRLAGAMVKELQQRRKCLAASP